LLLDIQLPVQALHRHWFLCQTRHPCCQYCQNTNGNSSTNVYMENHPLYLALGSLVVTALDSWLDGRGFNSWPLQQILRWVTIFKRANHLSISPSHPGTVGQEMSTSQKCSDAPWLRRKGGYGSFHLWINMWVAGKTVWPLLTCAIPQHFRDESWYGTIQIYGYSRTLCAVPKNGQQLHSNHWEES